MKFSPPGSSPSSATGPGRTQTDAGGAQIPTFLTFPLLFPGEGFDAIYYGLK